MDMAVHRRVVQPAVEPVEQRIVNLAADQKLHKPYISIAVTIRTPQKHTCTSSCRASGRTSVPTSIPLARKRGNTAYSSSGRTNSWSTSAPLSVSRITSSEGGGWGTTMR